MSVDYSCVLGYGVEIYEESPIDFLLDNKIITEAQCKEIEEEFNGDLEDFLYEKKLNVDVVNLNLYTSEDWCFLGFQIKVNDDAIQMADNVKLAKVKWENMFPNVKGAIVHTVRIS